MVIPLLNVPCSSGTGWAHPSVAPGVNWLPLTPQGVPPEAAIRMIVLSPSPWVWPAGESGCSQKTAFHLHSLPHGASLRGEKAASVRRVTPANGSPLC